MPNIAVGDVVQVTMRNRLFNQRLINTFHYRCSGVNAPTEYTAAMLSFYNWLIGAGHLRPDYLACLHVDVKLEQVWLQVIHPTRLFAQTFDADEDGTRAGASGTANVCASIERRAASANRRSVGRVQIPISSLAGDTVAGVITDELKALLGTLAEEMLVGFSSNVGALLWEPVLFGPAREETEDQPALEVLIQPLVDVEVKTTTRVMGRRTVGRGE